MLIVVPLPELLSILHEPLIEPALIRILARPAVIFLTGWFSDKLASNPFPLSFTDIMNSVAVYRSINQTRVALACFKILFNASCAILYNTNYF